MFKFNSACYYSLKCDANKLLFFTATTPFIEKKGYLYKMGGQRKTWKLRYFVLRPGVFNYFKNSSSHKALGEVKLKNISIFFPGIGELIPNCGFSYVAS